MKIAKQVVLPAKPVLHMLDVATAHVENSSEHPEEVKMATKTIVGSIQQNLNPIYPSGLYGAKIIDVKSSIIQTLKDIKDDFPEKPWLAALKGISTGLQLTGIGIAIYKGELGTGEIKDISGMAGLTCVSNAMVTPPPTDFLGIANLIVDKAIEFLEKEQEYHKL